MKIHLYAFIFLISCIFNATSSATMVFEEEIKSALDSRERFLKSLNLSIDQLKPQYLNKLSNNAYNSKSSNFEANVIQNNCWYHVAAGTFPKNHDQLIQNAHFKKAVTLAEGDPGTLWVLFSTFFSSGHFVEAEECLQRLEHYTLQKGILSVPIIAQGLLALDHQYKAQLESAPPLNLIDWSKRFESLPFWQSAYQIFTPHNITLGSITDPIVENIFLVVKSWFLQITMLHYLYQVFRIAVFFLLCILLIMLLLDTFPFFIHPVTEIFPSIVPRRLRIGLSVVIIGTLCSVKIIPALFIIILMQYQYMQNQKRKIWFSCLFLIALLPIDARINELFRASRGDSEACGLYRIARSGGNDISKPLITALQKNPKDYLLHCAAAWNEYHKGHMETAIAAILQANTLQSNDPVIIETAGILFAINRDTAKARYYFAKQLDRNKSDPVALFNTGQMNLITTNFIEGTEEINKASALTRGAINNFMQKNDFYFGSSWPMNRYFIVPDYTPLYFWIKVLPFHSGSWKSASGLWGSSFFGLSPLVSFLIMIISLFLILMMPKRKIPLRLLVCNVCGSPMCKNCKKGLICDSCSTMASSIHNKNLAERIKNRIAQKRNIRKKIILSLTDLLFHGAKSFYMGLKNKSQLLFILLLAPGISALYYMLVIVRFDYPLWVCVPFMICLLITLLLYSFITIRSTIRELSRDLKIKRK